MRAVETAQIIAGEHDGVLPRMREDLRECFLPSPIVPHAPIEVIQAGEKRAATAFTTYLRPTRSSNKIEIIVSHGNLIRYLASRVLGGLPGAWFRMRTLNCGITEIVIDSDEQRWLVSYNDVGHLPADLITDGVPRRSQLKTS
jgi:broad specificity phosphatase PhoE